MDCRRCGTSIARRRHNMDWVRSSAREAPRAAVNKDGAVTTSADRHTSPERAECAWTRGSVGRRPSHQGGCTWTRRGSEHTYVQRDALQPSPLHRSRRARSLHPMSAGIRSSTLAVEYRWSRCRHCQRDACPTRTVRADDSRERGWSPIDTAKAGITRCCRPRRPTARPTGVQRPRRTEASREGGGCDRRTVRYLRLVKETMHGHGASSKSAHAPYVKRMLASLFHSAGASVPVWSATDCRQRLVRFGLAAARLAACLSLFERIEDPAPYRLREGVLSIGQCA
jgi:hypothetical protein